AAMKPPWQPAKSPHILFLADRMRGALGFDDMESWARLARGQTVRVQVVDPPMSNVVSVTPDNIETVLADLPRMVRLALAFGSRLRRGTLDVMLPDDRVI